MKIQDLLEARKNPELNPKISLNAELKAYVDKFGKDGFISFTSIDKLGINPGSDYDTPIGIYAYPVMYAYHDVLGKWQHARRLPFAGSNPYATLFSATNGVIDLHTFSESDLASAIKKLKSIYGTRDVETSISYALESGRVQTAGGQLWAITMKLSKIIKGGEPPIVWNKIFRSIGINGCVDSDGEDIIHPNEPTQAVFFKKPGVIKNEKRAYNKYAPSSLKPNIEKGEMLKTAQATISALMRKYDNDRVRVFNALRNGARQQMSMLQLLPQSFIEAISVDDVTSRMFPTDDDLEDMDKIMKFTKYIRGKRWMRGEPLLLQDAEEDVADRAQEYCIRNMNSKRWPELERLLLSNNVGSNIIAYAEDVIKGRWTDAEAQLRKNPHWWREYQATFGFYDPSDD